MHLGRNTIHTLWSFPHGRPELPLAKQPLGLPWTDSLYSNVPIDVRVVRMKIRKWLGELVNRVVTEVVFGALLGVLAAVSSESGRTGAIVGGVIIIAFAILEVLNGARWAKSQC